MEEEIENCEPNSMILNLRKKREALEAILLEKSSELKNLCIAEAELTGILPMETPFEPNGSPPKFRKRVGTMFPFTEEMLSNLKPAKEPLLSAKMNRKGRVRGESPNKGRPHCDWLTKYDTLPAARGVAGPSSEPNHPTWPHPNRLSSPNKLSSRIHPYLNLTKKW